MDENRENELVAEHINEVEDTRDEEVEGNGNDTDFMEASNEVNAPIENETVSNDFEEIASLEIEGETPESMMEPLYDEKENSTKKNIIISFICLVLVAVCATIIYLIISK